VETDNSQKKYEFMKKMIRLFRTHGKNFSTFTGWCDYNSKVFKSISCPVIGPEEDDYHTNVRAAMKTCFGCEYRLYRFSGRSCGSLYFKEKIRAT